MRPPRYRFPDEVRSAIRTIATRMVQDGNIARTPEELEEWVAREPAIRETLEDGGYGEEFTAEDMLPLVHVFVVQAGGPDLNAPAAPPPKPNRWLIPVVIAVIVLVFVIIFAAKAFSRPERSVTAITEPRGMMALTAGMMSSDVTH